MTRTEVSDQDAQAFQQTPVVASEAATPPPAAETSPAQPPRKAREPSAAKRDLHVVLPADVAWRLKVAAAMGNTTRSELIARAVDAHCDKKGIPNAPENV